MTTMYNTAAQSVAAGGTVALTNVTNQKGSSTTSTTNGISIVQSGIYDIYATITGLVTGGGSINLAVQQNGTTIGYLVGAAYTNTGEPATITLVAPVVINPNCCAVTTNLPATITLVNNGTNIDVLSNAVLTVIKR